MEFLGSKRRLCHLTKICYRLRLTSHTVIQGPLLLGLPMLLLRVVFEFFCDLISMLGLIVAEIC